MMHAPTDSIASFSLSADTVRQGTIHGNTVQGAVDPAGIISDTLPWWGAEDVFGPHSALAPGHGDYLAGEVFGGFPLSDSVLFRITVLLCFAGSCLLLYYFRPYILYLFSVLKGRQQQEKLLSEKSTMFEYFLDSAMFLGIMAAGAGFLRSIDVFYGYRISEGLPGWIIPLGTQALILVICLIGAIQFLMLKSAGKLTGTVPFTDNIWRLKKILFTVSALSLMPFLFLFSLTEEGSCGIFVYIFAAGAILFWLWLFIRTLIMFIEQKISILFWFLYLCAVEIFPVSIFVLLVLKNT